MATMNVSLPDPMRSDQDRAAKIATMQRLVDEGLASGVAAETMDDILVEARARTDKSCYGR